MTTLIIITSSLAVLSILFITVTNGQIPLEQFQPSTASTPTPGAMTTASPQYLECLRRCPSVNQYNPVCGTDTVSYYNRFRLSCAQQCGRNVQVSHVGTCGPATGTAR